MDTQALRERYAAERAKRLRPEGNAQYQRLQGRHAALLADPYTPVQARQPRRDAVDFAFVGGGFAGLLTAARLKEAGLKSVRLIDKAGDFGGTWYWNRYPGAQCDTASLVYLPLLEETGYRPSEKYVHGPEIFAHCQRIGRHYGLYEDALFHTEVTQLTWQQEQACWRVQTAQGDDFTARFIGLGTGPLHVPKLPGIPGLESFAGPVFHTSRWDYGLTGGDAQGAPMHKLAGRRVALIGTGATAVQVVPRLARDAGQLMVFQRTPSSVDARDNGPIAPEWFASISAQPGWQQRWLENFTDNQAGGGAAEDWVNDGWTELAKRIREQILRLPKEQRTPPAMLAAFEQADHAKMNEIRARADALVHDSATAQQLKAWYRQLCKRPCFHDEYLQAYNRPNVKLIDTDGQGVQAITPHGVVAAGQEHEADLLIFASGFEVGTPYVQRAGFDLTGEGGQQLSEAWAQGMRSLHGVHVHGFPNAFFVQPTQGANLISNIPHNLSDAALSIAAVVAHAQAHGHRSVQPTAAAEQAWLELLLTGAGRMLGSLDCTPGYYNNEGQDPGPAARLNVGHPAGPSAYFKYIAQWRQSGRFEGLVFN